MTVEAMSSLPLQAGGALAAAAGRTALWVISAYMRQPLRNTAIVALIGFSTLAGANARFIEPEQVMAAQRAADVLVSDTSSIVSEFIVQHKPVVTLRNRAPKPHMIDFDDPARLPAMLERALRPTPELMAAIVAYADAIHPYRDGLSSERVIAATEDFIDGEMGRLKRKPLGALWRGLQIRRDLGYWGLPQR